MHADGGQELRLTADLLSREFTKKKCLVDERTMVRLVGVDTKATVTQITTLYSRGE